MGCFLACFGFSKKRRKRRKPSNKVLAGDHQVNKLIIFFRSFIIYLFFTFSFNKFVFCILLQQNGSYVPLDSSVPENLDVPEDPICSFSESRLDID